MAVVRLTLLGGFDARRIEGKAVQLPTRKAEALLAFLACKSGEKQPRDRLTALLWGDRSDPQARHSLSQALVSIRHAFDDSAPWLLTERETIAAQPGAIDLDVAEFQKLSHTANDLKGALELYRGPFLDGFSLRESGFEEWLTQERARLHGIAFSALLALADAQATAGDGDAAIATLSRAVCLDPLAEEAHRRLMRLQIDRGLCNDSVRQYRFLADVLKQELGTAPDPSTKALYQVAMDRLERTPQPRGAADRACNARVEPSAQPAARRDEPVRSRRACVAIMPFADPDAGSGRRARMAGGLTVDIITRLAKLRSLHIIAQGTVFALAEKGLGAEEASRILNVDYATSGTAQRQGDRVIVAIELVEVRSARIVWAERFDRKLDDTLPVLDEIGDRIVTAIASEIEMAERNRAILRPPGSLDAWEALHCGLWHMYRFNEADNERARRFFRTAIGLDPTLARAHAGLSFTHFQNAFLLRTRDRQREIDSAYDAAGQGIIADDRDPAAHWAMGRALWLRGRQEQSLIELENAVELSPNFALGHYTLAFVHCQSGNPCSAIGFSDHSRHLSPYDPMLFGMLATRALAHARLGQFDQAADWGVKAAARPNAHAHILAIAAQCLALADRVDEARTFIPLIHQTRPGYSIEDFLGAFRFDAGDTALFRKAAQQNGLS
jgi:TolB-like protein